MVKTGQDITESLKIFSLLRISGLYTHLESEDNNKAITQPLLGSGRPPSLIATPVTNAAAA